MKFVCILLISIMLLSGIARAEELPIISTPWNSNIYNDTWQEDTVIYAMSIIGKLPSIGTNIYKDLKNSWNNHKEKKRIGKEQYKENKRREFQDWLFGERTAEKMKETDPLWHTIIYRDFPQPLSRYKELEKYAEDWQDLEAFIKHIKKQNKKVKNQYARKEINKYIKDLEHIRDYQKELEQQEQLQTQTYITITLATIAILAKIMSLMAGVPM